MKGTIRSAETRMIAIDLEEPFKVAFGEIRTLPRVLYSITADTEEGIVSGVGEASIDFPFSHYDMWDVMYALKSAEKDIVGIPVDGRERLLAPGSEARKKLMEFPAAFCALNMALDDLTGKIEGKTVSQLYQGKPSTGGTLKSIGFHDPLTLESMLKKTMNQGYVPKPKVGAGMTEDLKTIAISDLATEGYLLDFNGGYRVEGFRRLLDEASRRGLLWKCLGIEQPTDPAEGIKGLAKAREMLIERGMTSTVIADESFVTIDDAIACAERGIGLNYKLQKIGGLYVAKEIEDRIAKTARGAMVGGTFPTAIGRAYDCQAMDALTSISIPSDGGLPSTEYFAGEKDIVIRNDNGGLSLEIDEEKTRRFEIVDPKGEYRLLREGKQPSRLAITLKGGQSYGDMYRCVTGREPDWNTRRDP